MHHTVIAISRTLGAGGESLGEAIADDLGFRYVDSEIIDRAAALAKATPAEIARVEERKGLLTRILDNLARSGVASGAAGFIEPPPIDVLQPGYEQLIIDVIKETAGMGAVVIVAHGASIPLTGTPGVLRVMVTASEESRVRRVAASEDLDFEQARRAVHESDAARADYFRRFYHLEHESPSIYDIVINTDVLSVSEAEAVVLAVAKG
jgi:cytidylate kinase